MEAFFVDGVYVRIRPARNVTQPLLAAAKVEPFVCSGLDVLREPGEVWFAFGDDKAALINQLVSEALSQEGAE